MKQPGNAFQTKQDKTSGKNLSETEKSKEKIEVKNTNREMQKAFIGLLVDSMQLKEESLSLRMYQSTLKTQGTSLVVQWLTPPSQSRDLCSIPGQGSRPHMSTKDPMCCSQDPKTQCSQINKEIF